MISYATLHHLVSILLEEYNGTFYSIETSSSFMKANEAMYSIVYTKLSYSLLSTSCHRHECFMSQLFHICYICRSNSLVAYQEFV